MRINGGNFGPIRPDAARDVRGPSPDEANRGQSPSSPDRVDRVEISDAGRARAAGLEAMSSTSGRLQEVRDRILRGAYDTNEVVGEVARRILDRGEI